MVMVRSTELLSRSVSLIREDAFSTFEGGRFGFFSDHLLKKICGGAGNNSAVEEKGFTISFGGSKHSGFHLAFLTHLQ